MTTVYTFNSVVERRALWEELISQADIASSSWMVLGDFNCILSKDEKNRWKAGYILSTSRSTKLFFEL